MFWPNPKWVEGAEPARAGIPALAGGATGTHGGLGQNTGRSAKSFQRRPERRPNCRENEISRIWTDLEHFSGRSWNSLDGSEMNPLNTIAPLDLVISFGNCRLLDLKQNCHGNSLRTNEIWPNPGDPAKLFQLRPQKCSKSGQIREISESESMTRSCVRRRCAWEGSGRSRLGTFCCRTIKGG